MLLRDLIARLAGCAPEDRPRLARLVMHLAQEDVAPGSYEEFIPPGRYEEFAPVVAGPLPGEIGTTAAAALVGLSRSGLYKLAQRRSDLQALGRFDGHQTWWHQERLLRWLKDSGYRPRPRAVGRSDEGEDGEA